MKFLKDFISMVKKTLQNGHVGPMQTRIVNLY